MSEFRPRVRRTLDRVNRRIEVQVDSGAGWVADGGGAVSAVSEEFELARYELLDLADGAEVLPVCPLSFRDFMLYEKHAVDAARGMARRFVPRGHAVGRVFERLTRRTFPPYRPARLWREQPIYYMSNAMTIVPSGTPISAPRYSAALDFELELGVVLAEPLRDATAEQVLDAIGHVVVINDFSARDVQLAEMRSGFGPQKSKHFVSSMSATAVAGAAVRDRLAELDASVRINGRTIATTSTRGPKYALAEAIAHASVSEQLFPGELFCTGTLPGGSGMETGRWLAAGDTLRLEIDGIGVIEHPIV